MRLADDVPMKRTDAHDNNNNFIQDLFGKKLANILRNITTIHCFVQVGTFSIVTGTTLRNTWED